MPLSSEDQANEAMYLNECKILLQQIGEATAKAVDALNKFDIKTNSDKICILTVGNNFSQNLEYALNDLQRVMIDNHESVEDNKNLKEVIQECSTFAHSIQLAFGNDFNKLKLVLINVLKNLSNKLNPLLEIVQEPSPYYSKWEIADILDYLYIAIEKLKMRTQWEHLHYKEILSELDNNILKTKLKVIDSFEGKDYLIPHCRRFSFKALEGILAVLQEIKSNLDYYDDNLRETSLNVINKISDTVFETDKATRNENGMTELIMYAKLCTKTIVLSLKEMFVILNNESVDLNDNIRKLIINAVVNGFSCSIRFTKDLERILQA